MTFYQFQKRFPNDAACLHQIMVSRYGGPELPCPKCQRDSKFHRVTRALIERIRLPET